ncbi:hypothetical protein TNCT_146301 [Trichonephila clavata]|uniref:Uncharacterized protein n=1 Tax=Trichonephila clavata TaxID=2740835 RepID=A0A8X6JQG7_TRICU|nr:hypothetical protein TNCT_146301 [Trichonephila clavata]
MRKPSDASVAFGGARPKIYPRNTFPYGDAVMEKTKSKKRRRAKTSLTIPKAVQLEEMTESKGSSKDEDKPDQQQVKRSY